MEATQDEPETSSSRWLRVGMTAAEDARAGGAEAASAAICGQDPRLLIVVLALG